MRINFNPTQHAVDAAMRIVAVYQTAQAESWVGTAKYLPILLTLTANFQYGISEDLGDVSRWHACTK